MSLSVPFLSAISLDDGVEFSSFDLVSPIQVKVLIKSLVPKSCSLDPLPTWLVNSCIDELLPVITRIINISLSSGVVPETFKTAHIVPLLKKSSLDRNDLKNYRPIANLPFLDKVLERIAAAQLKTYLDKHNMFPLNQSAYRQFHSTETALLKVMDDLLIAVDEGLEVILILLDFSSAFDTLDHDTLTCRLEADYHIKGTALKWIESYLKGRSQKIVVEGSTSKPFPLPWGVPQGSVVGPLFFILYSGPLGQIINLHRGVQHAIYADDTQMYLIMRQSDRSESIERLKDCTGR